MFLSSLLPSNPSVIVLDCEEHALKTGCLFDSDSHSLRSHTRQRRHTLIRYLPPPLSPCPERL